MVTEMHLKEPTGKGGATVSVQLVTAATGGAGRTQREWLLSCGFKDEQVIISRHGGEGRGKSIPGGGTSMVKGVERGGRRD